MWKFLEKFGIGGPEAQARQLDADAAHLVTGAEGQYGRDTLAHIATLLRERIDEVHDLSLGKTEYYEQGLKHLTEVNAEHRRANDQPAWSAITLAIIYLRAEMIGPAGAATCARIDAFLAHCLPAAEDAGTTANPPDERPSGR